MVHLSIAKIRQFCSNKCGPFWDILIVNQIELTTRNIHVNSIVLNWLVSGKRCSFWDLIGAVRRVPSGMAGLVYHTPVTTVMICFVVCSGTIIFKKALSSLTFLTNNHRRKGQMDGHKQSKRNKSTERGSYAMKHSENKTTLLEFTEIGNCLKNTQHTHDSQGNDRVNNSHHDCSLNLGVLDSVPQQT